MLDLRLISIDDSGEEVIVKNRTHENEEEAREQYDKLTEEYSEQSLPFFDKDEKLLKLEILPTDSDELISECYFEYSDELKGHLYQRV
jgi:hypothetical protein